MNKTQECNNPINLMLHRSIGECTEIRYPNPKTGLGLCYFPDAPAGFRAAHREIAGKAKRGLTLKQLVFINTPPNENDTNQYLEDACRELGCVPDTLLTHISRFALVGVLALLEGYYNV